MIDIPPLAGGAIAGTLAQFAVDGNQIDHRNAGPELKQPHVFADPGLGTAENILVEMDRFLNIGDTKHNMVKLGDLDRVHRHSPRFAALYHGDRTARETRLV